MTLSISKSRTSLSHFSIFQKLSHLLFLLNLDVGIGAQYFISRPQYNYHKYRINIYLHISLIDYNKCSQMSSLPKFAPSTYVINNAQYVYLGLLFLELIS